MKALILDDSRLAAASLAKVVAQVDPAGECEVFLVASEALERCAAEHIDVVFLDIEMPGTNGFDVARRMRTLCPQTNVVFVTGYPEYALDAWGTQASAFIVKPADPIDVARALGSLRVSPAESRDQDLYVQCFGNFQVFSKGAPLSFERMLTKELFAYLVDRRGAFVTTGELVSVLWEGLPDTRSRRSQLRTLISDLRRTLEAADVPDVLVRQRGAVAVVLEPFQCDYYAYLIGSPDAINRYQGEYMRQFSWAEDTAASLSQLAPQI